MTIKLDLGRSDVEILGGAVRFIDPDCSVCEGTGMVTINEMNDDDECQCVKVNRELASLADEHV